MPVDVNTLARLSAAAYRHVADENVIRESPDWTRIAIAPADGSYSDDPRTGFSAAAYKNAAGDVVIAFAGTNSDLPLGIDWVRANYPAATGYRSPQVEQAAQFYWQVLNSIGVANKSRITFTGHSLGGGLAGLMSVFFDLPAHTFDTAPFEATARDLAHRSSPSAPDVLEQYASFFNARNKRRRMEQLFECTTHQRCGCRCAIQYARNTSRSHLRDR